MPDTLDLRNSLVVLRRILLYCYRPVTVASMYAHERAQKSFAKTGPDSASKFKFLAFVEGPTTRQNISAILPVQYTHR